MLADKLLQAKLYVLYVVNHTNRLVGQGWAKAK